MFIDLYLTTIPLDLFDPYVHFYVWCACPKTFRIHNNIYTTEQRIVNNICLFLKNFFYEFLDPHDESRKWRCIFQRFSTKQTSDTNEDMLAQVWHNSRGYCSANWEWKLEFIVSSAKVKLLHIMMQILVIYANHVLEIDARIYLFTQITQN